MGFLKNILGKKDEPIRNEADFWNWFAANGQAFYDVVKSGDGIEQKFFAKLAPKLNELGEGAYFLVGMDGHTAELVLTADGVAAHIAWIEELAGHAPSIPNWKITALKPAMDIDNVGIRMADYTFDRDSLSFYAREYPQYPDEVHIVLAYDGYKDADRDTITNGAIIFIDNYLGELDSLTMIDRMTVIAKEHAEKELIPIAKLKDYLIWREKEFVEKYDDVRHDSEHDRYASLEGQLEDGNPLFVVVNTTLLDWDGKASHPWIMAIEVRYDGKHNNGLPDERTYRLLDEMEDEAMRALPDSEGYLNVGRQTAGNSRIVYFACREFRKPSLAMRRLASQYAGRLDLSFSIYKDKYWQSLEEFRPSH